jgi:hypothetical protein
MKQKTNQLAELERAMKIQFNYGFVFGVAISGMVCGTTILVINVFF